MFVVGTHEPRSHTALLRTSRDIATLVCNARNTYVPAQPTTTMARAWSGVSWLWVVVCILALIKSVHPVYFYFEAGTSKCFYEQLPADTIVVGHYYLEEWDETQGHFDIPKDISLGIMVKHLDSEHMLVNSRGTADGRFAFNSHDAGNHEICFQTEFHGMPMHNGRLPEMRMHIDIIIGDAHRSNTQEDQEHAQDLLSRARSLNGKMRDLRKEQQYQREREMEFRNLSERTNGLVMWCIIAQIVVLLACCVWQLFNLRTFFEDKKCS